MKTQEKLKKYLEEIKRNDKKCKNINAFLELRDEKELMKEAKEIDDKIAKRRAGKLAGMVIAVKANICVKGLNVSCASKTLENFKAPYDASVVRKIKQEDGLIIGITNMDEFACGSSGETSAFGVTKNPRALDLVTGGSSSGSAAAVAADFCDVALGSDTGGSIRNPASHCGVIGVKPTYGSVSRYGLIDLSMSLDQIGVLSRNVKDAELVMDVIYGRDARDAITSPPPAPQPPALKKYSKTKNKFVVGLLDLSHLNVDERIKKLVEEKTMEIAERNGWKVVPIKLNYIELAIATYYPLVYVEFFSGTRKFDGRRYGQNIDDSCSVEVLRRILGGSEISKAEVAGRYYYRALKAKKLIEKEFEKAFKKVDCIVSPVVPKLPHKIGSQISVEDMYGYDILTTPVNLAGVCGVSIPGLDIEGIPTGIQILCNKFEDKKMLEIAKSFEE